MNDSVTQCPDYHFRYRDALLGAQNLLVALGALVMVPMLIGLDPQVALFTAGLGTLLFQVLTKGKVPVFLGSSFAFLPPAVYTMQHFGLAATLGGFAVSAFAYVLMAALVRIRGVAAIERLLPPIVTGPVILSIGLVLAPVAVNMAMGRSGDGSIELYDMNTALMLAGVSLGVALVVRLCARGWMQLIPILLGVGAGYALSVALGVVDFSAIKSLPWLAMPNFTFPAFHWEAVFLIFPVALVSAVEHVGDVLAIGTITGRSYVKDPGLHRTLLGDGLATGLAGCLGGPPNTTYSEVTAGVAITRTFNPAIMTWAAISAILLSSVAKVGGVLQSIPAPVMGGLLILLFGTIAVIGLGLLVQSRVDLLDPRNMTIVGLILIIPLGGFYLPIAGMEFGGVGLGGLVGVLLNVILPPSQPSPVLGDMDAA